jgi:hypothetical protein
MRVQRAHLRRNLSHLEGKNQIGFCHDGTGLTTGWRALEEMDQTAWEIDS